VLEDRREIEPRPEDRISRREQQPDNEHDGHTQQRPAGDGNCPFTGEPAGGGPPSGPEHPRSEYEMAQGNCDAGAERRERRAQSAAIGTERDPEKEKEGNGEDGRD
jgi:hypothetical protein